MSKIQWPHLLLVFSASLVAVLIALKSSGMADAESLVKPELKLPAGAPDLLAVFAVNENRRQARHDAGMFAAICAEFAADVELDGKQPEGERIIKTGVQLYAIRKALRWYAFDGVSLQPTYPQLGTTLEKYLDAAAGTEPNQITEKERAAWVESHRVLAKAAEYARRKL